ncbi:hypothetical protein PV08_05877 [Exophiala spinifera]|uniref:DUF7924 domain-containing protein n=1 Tax=Exophiala spinifera TaxID=91928 RepID=A0A0D1ZSL5_9EURO|nr:uncharacterized protein PV08_05877 [Exophiala spinifera]KIW15827.1 hypothetical protein PV08_05877 [Exophiala spinifera]
MSWRVSSPGDMDYGDALEIRSILVEKARLPPELEEKALEIISRVPASGDMDLATLEDLRQSLRSEQFGNEANLVGVLTDVSLIPGRSSRNQILRINRKQLWLRCVQIPIHESFKGNVLDYPPLSNPKPDVTCGFSAEAFTLAQKITLQTLFDGGRGSYAMPDMNTVFPFFTIEFKSEATHGTHFVARYQAANPGAIALNGKLHLAEHSFGLDAFDQKEPHHFSITIAYTSARVNLHWVERPAKKGPTVFHVTALEHYPLMHIDGLVALSRAIRNILEYGVKTLLPKIREGLDAYKQKAAQRSSKTTRRKK